MSVTVEAPSQSETPQREVPYRISSEDGTRNWFPTDRTTKARGRREVAEECREPLKDFGVCKRWMRQATEADIDEYTIGRHMVEEGWWIECGRRDEGAFPVWMVE
jgi:hypothetical protein